MRDESSDAILLEGAQVPAGDGCNTCQCQDGMVGSCTEVACMPPACTEEDCGPAPGVPSFLCDDGVDLLVGDN